MVDRFGDYLVVQINSAGMDLVKEEVVAALEKVLSPKGILFRNDGKARVAEGLESYVAVAAGEVPHEVELLENGVKFLAPVHEGQKTGWFYDHRMNRARLAPYQAMGIEVVEFALKAERDLQRIEVEAKQKVASAKAEADALALQRQQITSDLLQLRKIENEREAIRKWDGKLPQVTGGNVPFIQLGAKTP